MTQETKITVWSLALRLFHWLLVCLVLYAFYTGQYGDGVDDMDRHVKVGVAILTLLVFRILWGCWGDQTAQFKNFLPKPKKAYQYLTKEIWQRTPAPTIGHSPSAALGAMSIILALFVQSVTGLFASDDILTEGPLCTHVSPSTCELMTQVHHLNSQLIKGLILAHLLAIAFYGFYKKDHLIPAMMTGMKKINERNKDFFAQPVMRSNLLALLTFIISAVIVWLVVFSWS